MTVAKGMTNREWLIHEKARCLQYLLSSIMRDTEEMRTSLIEKVSRLAEEESEGDSELRKERETYYMTVFNTAIPDDMEQSFLQSMVVQIYTYAEIILKDIAQNKKQDGGTSKVESYYSHIQQEKGVNLDDIDTHITEWNDFHKMRIEITHDGACSQKLTREYIEKKIDQVKSFLDKVEKA